MCKENIMIKKKTRITITSGP